MNAWIPLMDYAMKKGVSLSTLRRHIKANKIQYRVENGRYLLLDDETGESLATKERASPREEMTRFAMAARHALAPAAAPHVQASSEIQQLQAKLQKTQAELQRAQEEIVELKTLIAFYEDSASGDRGN